MLVLYISIFTAYWQVLHYMAHSYVSKKSSYLIVDNDMLHIFVEISKHFYVRH